MSTPLPTVTCPSCHIVQAWRNQENCTSCGSRFSNWSLFNQLHKNLPLTAKLHVRA